MYAIHELSQAVRTRRQEIGLSQEGLAKIAGLPRATIVELEGGTIEDLSFSRTAALLDVLGLGLTIGPAHPRMRSRQADPTPALELAARTASVSYARSITAAALGEALGAGVLPEGFEPHVYVLLDEASVSMLAKAVEQVHADSGVARGEIWANMRGMARQLKCTRDLWNVDTS